MSESTQVTVTDLNDGYAQQIEARTHQTLWLRRWRWLVGSGLRAPVPERSRIACRARYIT